MNPEDEAEEDGANIDLDSQRKGKCVVLKTSTRQVSQPTCVAYIFLCPAGRATRSFSCFSFFFFKSRSRLDRRQFELNLLTHVFFCEVTFDCIYSQFQTIFLPVVGLVDPDKLKPGDLVGVNKDSYLILDTLPSEYDSRVKAMEVDEKPTEDYNDIGGLEKQASFEARHAL